MNCVSAQWLDAGKTTIAALGDDGEIHFVPVDEGNADYRMISAGDPEHEVDPLVIADLA